LIQGTRECFYISVTLDGVICHLPGSVRSDFRVFIENMSTHTSWQDLKDHMRKAGEVLFTEIFKDHTGRSRGTGIAEYATEEAMERAIRELDDTDLAGYRVRVSEDRGGGGGGYVRDRERDRRDRRYSPYPRYGRSRSPPRRRSYSPRRRSPSPRRRSPSPSYRDRSPRNRSPPRDRY